ncbi:hypothetical protein JQ597_13420 [Bradyrhizobium sp. AUGA SZCCT0177]|nr:hypothetical protein [Bradyrhizobium sp. AUGA SZCCT0177]MBR1283040.1 hypothetical protein [Bradyrhizobium sp. AUGA SZCCT0177]
MQEYRAYVMGHDGHIQSSRAFVCENDDDASAWAKQLVDGHDGMVRNPAGSDI